MRTTRYLTLLSFLLLALTLSGYAQRTRRTTPRPTPKPTPVRNTVNPEVTAAKQKVANQLHNVNVFVDRMGPIAVAIENADKDAAARRLRQTEIDANNVNKEKTVTAIKGLRTALVNLETEFRAKPLLAAYLPKIQGISALAAQSEDSAIAGKFVASKDPLRQVALKLNETLAVLPGPLPAGTRPVSAPVSTPSRTVPVSTQGRTAPTATPPSTSGGSRAPSLGMTANEVLQSTWGTPTSKRTNQSGTTEVWTYSGNRTIYFYNGKVSNIVQ